MRTCASDSGDGLERLLERFFAAENARDWAAYASLLHPGVEWTLVDDGAELGFSTLAGGNLAPMAVPWELTRCWAEGYIAWTGMEGELLRVTYLSGYGDREIQADVWFDGMTPCRAELAYEGQKLISAGISNFIFEA